MELNAAIIAIIIFVVYVSVTTAIWGMQESISDTVYRFKRGWDILFSAFIIGISVPVLLFTDHGPLYFVAGGFGFLLAASPMFRGRTIRKGRLYHIEPVLHVVGATGMILALLAALWVHDNVWWTSVAGLIGAIVLKRPWVRRGYFFHKDKYGNLNKIENVIITFKEVKNYTFWVEIAEAICCFVGLIVVVS